MAIVLTRKFRFEAAHYIPTFPDGHKCRRMHGHSFKVTVAIEGQPDPNTGILMDFADVKAIVNPLVELLDHDCLNDIGKSRGIQLLINPTSENIAQWFFEELYPHLPGLKSIKVAETCTSACKFTAAGMQRAAGSSAGTGTGAGT